MNDTSLAGDCWLWAMGNTMYMYTYISCKTHYISSYCFDKDIRSSPNPYPNLLQLPILHPWEEVGIDYKVYTCSQSSCSDGMIHCTCRPAMVNVKFEVLLWVAT